MKRSSTLLFLLFMVIIQSALGQQTAIDKVKFFEDTSLLNVVIKTDVAKLIRKKHKEDEVFQARFIIKSEDNALIEADIDMEARGHFRRENCYIPPLKLTFDKDSTAPTAALRSLKLVTSCNTYGDYEQYVLKEYLVYKIYNLLTEKSLRVRLMNVEYLDVEDAGRNMQSHAFLIEDVKDAARRNNCREWKSSNLPQETTDRAQMTLVALFQYMIGNTDWSVPAGHNIKLIVTRTDEVVRPYPVAYDFDFSGLVNTSYSSPSPQLNIQSVTERLYRGYPRTMEELNEALQTITRQKENIYSLINNFDLLSARNKKNMTAYLDDFYSLIKAPKKVKAEFISNARKD